MIYQKGPIKSAYEPPKKSIYELTKEQEMEQLRKMAKNSKENLYPKKDK